MTKYKIFKGEKDESDIVFIQKEGEEAEKLVFEVIKKYSFDLLKATVDNADNTFTIEVEDASLESYKQIVETIFNSVIADNDLLDLYKETISLNEIEKDDK